MTNRQSILENTEDAVLAEEYLDFSKLFSVNLEQLPLLQNINSITVLLPGLTS